MSIAPRAYWPARPLDEPFEDKVIILAAGPHAMLLEISLLRSTQACYPTK